MKNLTSVCDLSAQFTQSSILSMSFRLPHLLSQPRPALMSPLLYHPRRKPFQIRVDDDEHSGDARERRKSGNFVVVCLGANIAPLGTHFEIETHFIHRFKSCVVIIFPIISSHTERLKRRFLSHLLNDNRRERVS